MTDLDPMLREAMARVRGPVDSRPSLTDVRRRARRHNRRRMAMTAGVVACTGVATAALIIRRDAAGSPVASPSGDAATSTLNLSTTTVYPMSTMTITPRMVWDALWNARYDPAGARRQIEPADQSAADVMPTAEQFGCTSGECGMMFTYVVWHEIAKTLGFGDVIELQVANPNIDFSVAPVEGEVLQTLFSNQGVTSTVYDETPTTVSLFDGVILIDGGAPEGAMEDAYARLAGYNRVIVAGTASAAQTRLMPIGDHALMATTIGALFGIDGLDTWDPALVVDPIQGVVAVVIGPDYWDLIQQATSDSTTTTTIAPTTSIGP